MASKTKDRLLALLRQGEPLDFKERLRLTLLLSVPAILAQLSTIVMQYIDAAMVGSLGADDSASVGLVTTTTWLFNSICSAAVMGFAVQVAHLTGASEFKRARKVVREAFTAILVFSGFLGIVGVAISGSLPHWLGGNERIAPNATLYFRIFMLFMPVMGLNQLANAMLRCSGNLKVPSMLGVLMCVLNVALNFLMIFPARRAVVIGTEITIPGLGLGVEGAALGTAAAWLIVAVLALYYLVFRSAELSMVRELRGFLPTRLSLKRACRIGTPMGIQYVLLNSAQIVLTMIVAPLGSVAIAANSFAITAESLCYMPGFGISNAAITLTGQSLGAGRQRLARQFGNMTVGLGTVTMSVMGVLLYVCAPLMMGLMSPVPEIVRTGTECLRIEAWAEPLFAASIVCNGVFTGAGDTRVPCLMNLLSMWGVRISLALLLVGRFGLTGVWIAMCAELCFRGVIFLVRFFRENWLRQGERLRVNG